MVFFIYNGLTVLIHYHSTPDRFVEIGGSKLNEVSYQLARAYCVPCKGVYVAEPSGSKFGIHELNMFFYN